ncbi:MAG: Rieske (2Fe-2S) protein [Catenulispora sp.]|nr:Rieske (2Fe-2S) protein [Catenulispora sp.]
MTSDSAADVPAEDCASRRAVLGTAVGAAGALCGGCATYGAKSGTPAPAATTSAAGSSGPAAPPAAAALAASSAVPVGGGTILADRQIVLAQPTAGTFKAFTAVCTHQGCTVSSIDKGLIICPCHGSRFHLADGSVAAGPAARPLAPVAIKVADGRITLA